MRKGAFKELEIQKMGDSMNDQFKSLGFTVGQPNLIQQSEDRTGVIIEKSIGNSEQVGRHGMGGTARDRIEFQENNAVSKSLSKMMKGRPENESLKNMRGENFHDDNKMMYEGQNEVEEIDTKHDQDKITEKEQAKKSFTQEELFLKAMGELVPEQVEEEKPAPKKKVAAPAKVMAPGPAMPVIKKGPLVKWAKEEEEEHEEEEETKKSFDHLADLCDLIKGDDSIIQTVPDQNDPKVIAKIHENSKELERKPKAPSAAKGFLKSAGPGGFVFDFGHRTGNPIADNATDLLNRHGDKTQMDIAAGQRAQYEKSLNTYVTKGRVDEQPDFGQQEPSWNRQMNTPMDQQVAEAYERGQLDERTAGGPSIPAPGMAKSEGMLNGERIVAMSETDAAVLEMFKAEQASMNTEGMNIADVSMGGAQRVTIDAKTGQAN